MNVNEKRVINGLKTLLHLAALEGKLYKIKKLIEYGANPYMLDINNRTPFILCNFKKS